MLSGALQRIAAARAGSRAVIHRARRGVDVIRASTRADAYWAWGWLDAAHRPFQMDMARRAAGGTLAELFGPGAVEGDVAARTLGVAATAAAVVERLPPDQAALLDAYVAGLNAGLPKRGQASLAHAALRHRMAPWAPTDTILVLLLLYRGLAFDLAGRRAEHALRAALDDELVRFLTPASDVRADGSLVTRTPVPHGSIDAILAGTTDGPGGPVPGSGSGAPGSNCWTVPRSRTASGVPILACDLHLPVTLPNTWRRVELDVEGLTISGIATPGLPIVVSGANGHVAWGITNVPGDTLDLVPEPEAARPRTTRTERIAVRGADDHVLEVVDTDDGPVLTEPLMGGRMVARWSGAWPSATDLGLTRLAFARSLEELVDLARAAGAMPLNVHVASSDGRSAQTVSGRVPSRSGGRLHRDEFRATEDVPVLLDGGHAVLVSANDPGVPRPGWNHPPSWRAGRIRDVVASRDDWSERTTYEATHDARAVWLDDYRDLAVRALAGRDDALRAVLVAWDGTLRPGSLGAPVLARFRKRVTAALLGPLLARCRDLEPAFEHSWRITDPVALSLLDTGDRRLLPGAGGDEMDDRVAALLREIASDLEAEFGVPIADLSWGTFAGNRAVHNVFHGTWLARLFPSLPLPALGADDCICAAGDSAGPTQRIVVAPGREDRGLYGMFGGQSESPLSRHWSDHHRPWVEQIPVPFRAERR